MKNNLVIKKRVFLLVCIPLFLFSFKALGFLENTMSGYSNCLACHYSPAGGDLLNNYGRSLSSELMSTWSLPGAELAFGGVVKESEWMKFGGDVRTVQRYLNTPQIESRTLFIMQNNLEIGLKHKNLMLIGTLGTTEGPSSNPEKSNFLAERYYFLAKLSSASRLRVGKFKINYGLNDPNHNRMIKRTLGFGSYSEKYNLEYSRFYDNLDFTVNYSLGRVDKKRLANDERSFSTKFNRYLGSKSRIGLSYLYGESPLNSRSLLGTFGIIPIAKKFYIVYEVDYENKKTTQMSNSVKRILTHTKLGYNAFKGFKIYSLYDFEQNFTNSNRRITAPGLGIQWLPFPHFQLQAEYQKINFPENLAPNHFGFIMVHIYY